MQLNPDILLSLSGLMVSQPLSQSVGRGFESQGKCWDFFLLSIHMFTYLFDWNKFLLSHK